MSNIDRFTRPGALRHRLILERPLHDDDGGGGESGNWQEVATLWAAIRPLRGGENYIAGQTDSRISHEIILRWREGLAPEMRLRQGSRIFEILAVINVDEKNAWARLLCEERGL